MKINDVTTAHCGICNIVVGYASRALIIDHIRSHQKTVKREYIRCINSLECLRPRPPSENGHESPGFHCSVCGQIANAEDEADGQKAFLDEVLAHRTECLAQIEAEIKLFSLDDGEYRCPTCNGLVKDAADVHPGGPGGLICLGVKDLVGSAELMVPTGWCNYLPPQSANATFIELTNVENVDIATTGRAPTRKVDVVEHL